MSLQPGERGGDEFEIQARRALEESLLHVDGRIRSRLTQARHAALAEAVSSRQSWWLRPFAIVPATGAVAAAALVALFLWRSEPQQLPMAGSGQAAPEDIALLTDGEMLDMLEANDTAFYEWAGSQS